MKQHLLTALGCIALAGPALAQPTLTGANYNPFWGDKFVSQNCDTSGVTPGAGGASRTWNFSGLSATTRDTGTAVMCGFTTTCMFFPGSTTAIINPNQSLRNYIIADNSRLSQNGVYISPTQNVGYTNPMDQFRYPFAYLNSFVDTYASVMTFSGSTFFQNGTVNVTYDGYGTLTLPGSVTHSNVLRVHSSQVYVDSSELFGNLGTYNVESYTWYTPNYHAPLLTISTATSLAGTFKQVSYASVQLVAAVTDAAAGTSKVTTYPNPATGMLHVDFDAVTGNQYKVTVTDVTGRQVAELANGYLAGSQHLTWATDGVPAGMYLVRVQTNNQNTTQLVAIK